MYQNVVWKAFFSYLSEVGEGENLFLKLLEDMYLQSTLQLVKTTVSFIKGFLKEDTKKLHISLEIKVGYMKLLTC